MKSCRPSPQKSVMQMKTGPGSYQCLPTQGTLPQGEKEAAVSTIVLDLLGVPQRSAVP